LFRNLRDGDAEAKEAGVNAAEGFFYGRVIQEVFMNIGAQLGTGVHERATHDGANFGDNGRSGAGFQSGVANRPGGAEKKNYHDGELCLSLLQANRIWSRSG